MERGATFRIFRRGLGQLAAAAVGVGALAFAPPLVRIPMVSQAVAPSAINAPTTIERPRRLGRVRATRLG